MKTYPRASKFHVIEWKTTRQRMKVMGALVMRVFSLDAAVDEGIQGTHCHTVAFIHSSIHIRPGGGGGGDLDVFNL